MQSACNPVTVTDHFIVETVVFRGHEGNIKNQSMQAHEDIKSFFVMDTRSENGHTHYARDVTSFLRSLCNLLQPFLFAISYNLHSKRPWLQLSPAKQPWFDPNSFQLWCKPPFMGSDPEAGLNPLEHLAADWPTFSLQTALNLQPRNLPTPSLPTQTVCVWIHSEAGLDTRESSCIKQHQLFLRLASCREEDVTDDALLVYIFIHSLAPIKHCKTRVRVFAEGWEMMKKWSKLNFLTDNLIRPVFCLKRPDAHVLKYWHYCFSPFHWITIQDCPSLDDLNKWAQLLVLRALVGTDSIWDGAPKWFPDVSKKD